MHLLFILIRHLAPIFFFLALFNTLYKILRDGTLFRDFKSNMGEQGGANESYGSTGNGGQGSGSTFAGARAASPYQILGLPREATDDEIRARYRELIAKYHPDKFAGLDDPEFTRLAAKKFQQVQAAYEELKRRRGF